MEENQQAQKPQQVPAAKTPVQIEEEVLKFWNENHIFEKTLEKTKDKSPYIFYDGPPFATGLPHYGHILSSTIKDTVPRYWTMKGYYVRRRWGWDCHGLPIEQLVEQKLGISGKKQIEDLGIDKFCETCRTNVLTYVTEWGKTVNRMGRFVEYENSYKTMDSTFMESVWWALKQTWDKDLIYEGRKVLLYCPRCETPVSNFEVAMDNSYDDLAEESVYVRVPLKDAAQAQGLEADGNTYFLFWTTTPWTVPANVALAVGKDIDYVLIKPSQADLEAGVPEGKYILAKNRVEILFNNPEILKEFKGSQLVGASYQPPFNLPELASPQSHKVYDADFVTTEDGTGIVHTAVVYGEDDYQLGLRVGLPVVPLITQNGIFNELTPDFLKGKFYKSTEPEIIAKLKEQGSLVKSEVFTHSVPFCWRCGTQLFYNAIPAWFINVQRMKPRLLELNEKQINWYPAHLKEGRFKKGVEGAPDWNISRNRYWATPLPFWKCTSKSCGRTVCVGSLAELQEKATNYDQIYKSRNIREVDLHRPMIDQIVLECGVCGNEMHRIPEVIDCWVESASMPFAELHYPFENKEEFTKRFPAQFVAEYINQTRAWFYVMHVLSTILFDRAPFENVVNTGVVLAEDGQKMSKSKGNYPDPNLIIEKYGADALRYYLLSSPVMQADNLAFSEKELDEIYKKLILIILNVHSFLRMYEKTRLPEDFQPKSENILDKWILAQLHKLQTEVTRNMENYDTVRATRPMMKFVNDLSTWYVRRSRDRFKSGDEKGREGLDVLAHVLAEFSKLAAPFMPFIPDYLYKDLTGKESVHLTKWPDAGFSKLSPEEESLLEKMELVRSIVELGQSARKEAEIKVRQPLEFLVYKPKNGSGSAQGGDSESIHAQAELDPELQQILAEELNVKEVHFAPEIEELPESVVKENQDFTVLLSTKISPELREEGLARELERQVQDMRKKFGFKVGELVDLFYNSTDPEIEKALVEKFDRKKTFVSQIKKELEIEADYEAQVEIEGKPLWFGLVKVG